MVALGGANSAGQRRVPGESTTASIVRRIRTPLMRLPVVKARAVREVAPPFCDLTTCTGDLFPKGGGDLTCSSRRRRACSPRYKLWARIVYLEGFGQVSGPDDAPSSFP